GGSARGRAAQRGRVRHPRRCLRLQGHDRYRTGSPHPGHLRRARRAALQGPRVSNLLRALRRRVSRRARAFPPVRAWRGRESLHRTRRDGGPAHRARGAAVAQGASSGSPQGDRVTVMVRFLGSGNAFSDGGRANAAIHVTAPGVSLLLDCGGSALPAIKKHLDPASIDAIAVTHLHGDHFGGITFLVLEQHFAGRKRELVVGGPPSLDQRLGADLFICEASYFDSDDPAHISYRQLMAHRAQLGAKRIVLTHLGAETLAHLTELELEHAQDGTVVEV